jgi:hypothetical protein
MLSGFISNLGQIKMPEPIADRIESFTFIPAPSAVTLTNASMLSWKETLVVSFGSLAVSRTLEKYFFRKLRELGFSVSVRCRDEQE